MHAFCQGQPGSRSPAERMAPSMRMVLKGVQAQGKVTECQVKEFYLACASGAWEPVSLRQRHLARMAMDTAPREGAGEGRGVV